MIPAIGLWSAITNLRCPACNHGVGWQVSNQASLLGHHRGKECRHCGKTIFDERMYTRFKRRAVVIFVLTIIFFVGVAYVRR